MEVHQNFKNGTIIWSSHPTSGYIPKGMKINISKKYLHSHVHCSIIHSSQDIETTEVSVNGWMDKENVICIHTMEYYSTSKRKRKSCHLWQHGCNFSSLPSTSWVITSVYAPRPPPSHWSWSYTSNTHTRTHTHKHTHTVHLCIFYLYHDSHSNSRSFLTAMPTSTF